jgi:NAD(P)-dependent dehydrogenase (short-subunit alcohol dehydrogenase family)
MNDYQNGTRVCLLTGAGGTLGSELSKAMDRRYLVSAICRKRAPKVDSQEIRFVNPLRPATNEKPTTYIIRADLEDEAQIERVVELTLARFGKIDLLINNAVHYSFGAMVATENLLEEASRQFEINTLVPLRLAVTVARMFWRQRRAENLDSNRNVINVSSTSGTTVYPNQGQSVYSASKAALNCLTLHMSHEFARFGVRVNAVSPTTFPHIVSTARVAEEILRIDSGSESGGLIFVENDQPTEQRSEQKSTTPVDSKMP